MKWVIGVVVVVILGYLLWNSGMLGGSSASQPAAAGATVAADMTDSGLAHDVAAIDSMLQGISPTGGAAIVAPAIQKAVTAMKVLGVKMQSRILNVPRGTDTTILKKAISDMAVQLSNASSNAGASVQTKIAVAQAQAYVQSAYQALMSARTDVGQVVSGLQGK